MVNESREKAHFPRLFFNKGIDLDVLRTASVLEVRDIAARQWETLVSECRAHDLRIYCLRAPSLEGIQRLRSTRALAIRWATKITTLEPVFEMSRLESLELIDLARIRSLDGIERLHGLTTLELSGNPGSLTPPMRLGTLRPLAKLPHLRSLAIRVMRLEDGDIRCLASIRTLRSLTISNQFEREQFAFLAKRLNDQLEEPITAFVTTGRPCPECESELHMFTGRRQPFLCRECEPQLFERKIKEFAGLVLRA